jgi:hypothetical protein
MTPGCTILVGAVSHLPQLTASALMHVGGKLAGDAGLRSPVPACSIRHVWRPVSGHLEGHHRDELDVLREALAQLIHALTDLKDSLATGEGVDAVFTSASRWRTALDRNR